MQPQKNDIHEKKLEGFAAPRYRPLVFAKYLPLIEVAKSDPKSVQNTVIDDLWAAIWTLLWKTGALTCVMQKRRFCKGLSQWRPNCCRVTAAQKTKLNIILSRNTWGEVHRMKT